MGSNMGWPEGRGLAGYEFDTTVTRADRGVPQTNEEADAEVAQQAEAAEPTGEFITSTGVLHGPGTKKQAIDDLLGDQFIK